MSISEQVLFVTYISIDCGHNERSYFCTRLNEWIRISDGGDAVTDLYCVAAENVCACMKVCACVDM